MDVIRVWWLWSRATRWPATKIGRVCSSRRTIRSEGVASSTTIAAVTAAVRTGRRIAIVGLGLIGGSLGLALRASGQGWEVVGHNRHHEAAGRAQKRGAIDRAEWNLPRAVAGADLVILAVAPLAMEKVLADVAPHLEPGAIVTDVASTKSDVLAWAERILPENVHFVGGHPMAGKETGGIDAAEATLFRGATYCILPGARCAPEAVTRVESLVRAVGAVPYFLDPIEHDSYVAAISHVPFIAATALVSTVTASPSWRDMARMAAGGFRDATRTASADAIMHRDICLTNRTAIAHWLDGYIAELARVRELLADDSLAPEERSAQLEQFFVDAKVARDRWEDNRRAAMPEDAPLVVVPTAREGLGQMFFGRRGKRD
jgi:prephenate dehydrogenase